jgi:hypothetical protein
VQNGISQIGSEIAPFAGQLEVSLRLYEPDGGKELAKNLL